MTPVQILFIVIAAATLGSALMVVTARNLIHAALWLIVALFGIAVFYALLSAGFLAMAQVVVYIGAIAILMIFAIMLTRPEHQNRSGQLNSHWGWAAVIAAALFGGLVWVLNGWPGIGASLPAMSERSDPLRELGLALVAPNAYVLPFELASVLLLAALIGSIVIAWDKK